MGGYNFCIMSCSNEFTNNQYWLVVWIIIFSIRIFILSTDEIIFFQRGGSTTNQKNYLVIVSHM